MQDPDRERCRTGRIWAYVSQHGTVYDATEDRSRDGPLVFLTDFRGYLQCDVYAGYDELFGDLRAQSSKSAAGLARRKFVDAEKTSPREAYEAVARIKPLYAIEHEAKEIDVAARRALRQEKSVPLLAALKVWLDQLALTALPKSPLGEAVTYARNQWVAFNVYITDGRLAIDNNTAERAVKTTERDCTGKYRLFAGSFSHYSWDVRPAGSSGVAKPTRSGGNRMSESQKNSGRSCRRVVLLSS